MAGGVREDIYYPYFAYLSRRVGTSELEAEPASVHGTGTVRPPARKVRRPRPTPRVRPELAIEQPLPEPEPGIEVPAPKPRRKRRIIPAVSGTATVMAAPARLTGRGGSWDEEEELLILLGVL